MIRNEQLPECKSPSDRSVLKTLPGSGYSGINERSALFHAFLEHSMTILFPLLFIPNVYFAVNRLWELELIWLVALAIPLSFLWSDLVSGLVHWTADTYFSEDTPLIGATLIKPFRLHHLYPRDICMHSFVTTVGNACILAVPLLSICLYLMWSWPVSGWVAFAILCIAFMTAATVATNQFHKWAHQETPSRMVIIMQRLRLVLSPTHHDTHHTEPFDMHYCITNGWLNPLLNKIKFFRGLEVVLGFVRINKAKAAASERANRLIRAGGQLSLSSPFPSARPEAQ